MARATRKKTLLGKIELEQLLWGKSVLQSSVKLKEGLSARY